MLLKSFYKPKFILMGNTKTSLCTQNSLIKERVGRIKAKKIVFKKMFLNDDYSKVRKGRHLRKLRVSPVQSKETALIKLT